MNDATAHPTRRSVLRAGAHLTLAGAVVTVLTGCGGGRDDDTASTDAGTPAPLSADALERVSAAIAAKDVGVGKAIILREAGFILSQPTAGSYVVFRDVCTHQGSKISELSDNGNLRCPLHGSEFDAATGEVKVGPAAKPLTARKVSVRGGKATVA